ISRLEPGRIERGLDDRELAPDHPDVATLRMTEAQAVIEQGDRRRTDLEEPDLDVACGHVLGQFAELLQEQGVDALEVAFAVDRLDATDQRNATDLPPGVVWQVDGGGDARVAGQVVRLQGIRAAAEIDRQALARVADGGGVRS